MREETIVTLPIPAGALWGFLVFAAALFLIVSGIVHHHWHYYGIRESDRTFAAGLYYTVAGALILGMAVSALAYTTF